jgi:Ricin-type beta-trefoil lectin domain
MRRIVPYASRTLAVAAGAMLAVAALAASTAGAAMLNGAAHAVPGQPERQLWLSTGYHVFSNDDSGKCLNQDYNGGPHPDVLAYACVHSPNELWNVIPSGDGSFRLANELSGGCLTQTGAGATVHPCDGSAGQAWYHASVDGLPGYYFLNQATGACLNQDWNSGVQHQDVLVWSPCDFTPNERWTESS